MSLPMDVADKYIKTLVDFWTLRPRAFIDKAKKYPDRYLSPAKFFLSTLSIMSLLELTRLSLYRQMSAEALERFPVL